VTSQPILDSPQNLEGSRKSRSRRQSMIEWGSNPSGSDMAVLEERRKCMQEFVRKKERRPHYSQVFGGKFEIMSADDDPINQVISVRAI
jgi:hypothetical protein